MRAAGLILLAGCAAQTTAPAKPSPIEIKTHEPLRVATSTVCAPARTEMRVQSEPGVEIFVMQMRAPDRRGAVVFTHGAGSPSSSLWDLPGDYSFMRKLACAGFDSYTVDVRGFGGSTKPASLASPAEQNPPAVRAREVMADVAAVVELAKKTSSVKQVDLIGWSWGSLVAGMYSAQHPEQIRRLVLFAPVYDRKWPKRHQTEKAWVPVKREVFFQYFDEKSEERSVLEAFVEALFRFTKADTLRLPNGPYADLYGQDAPIWNAGEVRAETLVVRGDEDRASLGVHAEKLFTDLKNAPTRRYVVLGGAGHFAFRTRMYRQLHAVVLGFLRE